MPRNRFDDPDTPGLYAQLNWRRHDEIPDSTAPGHIQISTHDEQADARVAELLDGAGRLVAMLVSAVRSGESMTRDDEWLVAEWKWKATTFRSELTGTYVTLNPDTQRGMIRTLHRAGNQVWPPRERTPGILDGVSIPRAAELAHEAVDLPAPGATGYKLPPVPPHE